MSLPLQLRKRACNAADRSSIAPALMESVLCDPPSAVTPLQINALWRSDTIDPQIDLQQDR